MKNRLSDYAWTAIPGLIILALVAAFIVPLFIWFGCRIEVGPGQMAVLVKKAGDDPAPGTIISSPTEKGVQLEVLSEGRYFRNPLLWDWSEFPISDIPQGKLGVGNSSLKSYKNLQNSKSILEFPCKQGKTVYY